MDVKMDFVKEYVVATYNTPLHCTFAIRRLVEL